MQSTATTPLHWMNEGRSCVKSYSILHVNVVVTHPNIVSSIKVSCIGYTYIYSCLAKSIKKLKILTSSGRLYPELPLCAVPLIVPPIIVFKFFKKGKYIFPFPPFISSQFSPIVIILFLCSIVNHAIN